MACLCCGLHAHRTEWLLSFEHVQQYTIYSSLQRLEWDEHRVSCFTDLDSSKATADHYILIVIFKIESWWQSIGSQASGRDNNAIVKVLKRGQEFTERAETQSHVWGFRCIVCHHKSHNKHERGTCFSLLNSEVYHDSNQISKKPQISNKNLLPFPVGGNVPRKHTPLLQSQLCF